MGKVILKDGKVIADENGKLRIGDLGTLCCRYAVTIYQSHYICDGDWSTPYGSTTCTDCINPSNYLNTPTTSPFALEQWIYSDDGRYAVWFSLDVLCHVCVKYEPITPAPAKPTVNPTPNCNYAWGYIYNCDLHTYTTVSWGRTWDTADGFVSTTTNTPPTPPTSPTPDCGIWDSIWDSWPHITIIGGPGDPGDPGGPGDPGCSGPLSYRWYHTCDGVVAAGMYCAAPTNQWSGVCGSYFSASSTTPSAPAGTWYCLYTWILSCDGSMYLVKRCLTPAEYDALLASDQLFNQWYFVGCNRYWVSFSDTPPDPSKTTPCDGFSHKYGTAWDCPNRKWSDATYINDSQHEPTDAWDESGCTRYFYTLSPNAPAELPDVSEDITAIQAPCCGYDVYISPWLIDWDALLALCDDPNTTDETEVPGEWAEPSMTFPRMPNDDHPNWEVHLEGHSGTRLCSIGYEAIKTVLYGDGAPSKPQATDDNAADYVLPPRIGTTVAFLCMERWKFTWTGSWSKELIGKFTNSWQVCYPDNDLFPLYPYIPQDPCAWYADFVVVDEDGLASCVCSEDEGPTPPDPPYNPIKDGNCCWGPNDIANITVIVPNDYRKPVNMGAGAYLNSLTCSLDGSGYPQWNEECDPNDETEEYVYKLSADYHRSATPGSPPGPPAEKWTVKLTLYHITGTAPNKIKSVSATYSVQLPTLYACMGDIDSEGNQIAITRMPF